MKKMLGVGLCMAVFSVIVGSGVSVAVEKGGDTMKIVNEVAVEKGGDPMGVKVLS